MKTTKTKTTIKDIFSGEYIQCWSDGDYVTIGFPYSTVSIPMESWAEVKKELRKVAK